MPPGTNDDDWLYCARIADISVLMRFKSNLSCRICNLSWLICSWYGSLGLSARRLVFAGALCETPPGACNDAPQFSQKCAPSATCAPHCEQNMDNLLIVKVIFLC